MDNYIRKYTIILELENGIFGIFGEAFEERVALWRRS